MSFESSPVEMPHNYIIPGISAEASEMGYRTEQCFVEYLREHATPDSRVHYSFIAGGKAPNIVPEHAALEYYIRARDQNLPDLLRRVLLIAKGAAMMTETKGCISVEYEWQGLDRYRLCMSFNFL